MVNNKSAETIQFVSYATDNSIVKVTVKLEEISSTELTLYNIKNQKEGLRIILKNGVSYSVHEDSINLVRDRLFFLGLVFL
jgi:hypothetical protein